MKQKCMWILFKMGLSLFTPDYMSEGREIDEHQEREALYVISIRIDLFYYTSILLYFYFINNKLLLLGRLTLYKYRYLYN